MHKHYWESGWTTNICLLLGYFQNDQDRQIGPDFMEQKLIGFKVCALFLSLVRKLESVGKKNIACIQIQDRLMAWVYDYMFYSTISILLPDALHFPPILELP